MRRNDREVKDINEIEEIIRLCKTCHAAMVDDGKPYVVPLSYGYRILDNTVLELYFHSAYEGRKIDILKRNNRVCFEMMYEGKPVNADTPCNSGYYYASVIGNGEVVFITDAAGKCEALSMLCKHQIGKETVFTDDQTKNVCIFKITSTEFTGKKKTEPNLANTP